MHLDSFSSASSQTVSTLAPSTFTNKPSYCAKISRTDGPVTLTTPTVMKSVSTVIPVIILVRANITAPSASTSMPPTSHASVNSDRLTAVMSVTASPTIRWSPAIISMSAMNTAITTMPPWRVIDKAAVSASDKVTLAVAIEIAFPVASATP